MTLRTLADVVRKGATATTLVALLLGLALAMRGPHAPPQRFHGATEAIGTTMAVATEHEAATDAAMEVLRRGGNAVDAAIAAVLVLGVVTPSASGLGGGGFALIYTASDASVVALDFRETAPLAVNGEVLARRPLAPEQRGHLVGVPGEPAGLFFLHARYGSVPMEALAARAIALAEGGFEPSAHLRRIAGRSLPRAPASMQKLLADFAGSSGKRVLRPELARTIRTLVAQGPDAFYRGALTEALVAAARAYGSPLTREDFAAYRVVERPPLRLEEGSRVLWTMPPPSAGGVFLLELLSADRLLRDTVGYGLARAGARTAEQQHWVAELLRGAFDDRAQCLGDPMGMPCSVEALLDRARLRSRLQRIEPFASHTAAELRIDGGTSHLSIVDAMGNAVALTTTVNGPFGAGIVAGTTGILLNDQLDDFALPDRDERANRPRPGARPTSSMTPVIVVEHGRVRLVAGASGGLRIATSVAQVVLAIVHDEESAIDAVSAPRLHVLPDRVLLEAPADQRLLTDLRRRGERVEVAEAMNAVQLIVREPRDDLFHAVADGRKGAVAAAQ